MTKQRMHLRPGVYVVRDAIPELDARPGDHITICLDDWPIGMLHRDLEESDVAAALVTGSVDRIDEVTSASAPPASLSSHVRRRLGGAQYRRGGRHLQLE